jgi:hypothetical protein
MSRVMEIDEQVLAAKFEALLPHLGERQRRLVLGAEARWLGHGGIELAGYLAGQLKSADPDCAAGPRVTREQPDDAYRGALPHAMTAGNEREK